MQVYTVQTLDPATYYLLKLYNTLYCNFTHVQLSAVCCDKTVLMVWPGLGTNPHLVRVRKRCFGQKYLFWLPQTQLKMSHGLSPQSGLETFLRSAQKYPLLTHFQVLKCCGPLSNPTSSPCNVSMI